MASGVTSTQPVTDTQDSRLSDGLELGAPSMFDTVVGGHALGSCNLDPLGPRRSKGFDTETLVGRGSVPDFL